MTALSAIDIASAEPAGSLTASPGKTAGRSAAEPAARLVFEVAGQIFAVAVARVREILDLQPISPLPNAPADLLGMIDVRGKGVAVIDLHARLGLRSVDREEGRILVFEIGSANVPVAAIADRVIAVAEIPDDEIEPAPESLTGWRADALRGVARLDGRITMILDLDRIFHDKDPFDFE